MPECAIAEHCEGRIRNVARDGERATENVELNYRREIAVPQQPRRLLECGALGKLVDLIARDDELATCTVDVTELRGCRDDTFQSADRHVSTVAVMYDRVNVDWRINMNPARSSWIAAAEASRLLAVRRTTLYAYVSRGFIRSQASPGRCCKRCAVAVARQPRRT